MDIGNCNDNSTWLPIVAGVIVAEIFFIIVYGGLFPILAEWYKRFGLYAVMADCLVILLAFAIARYIYTYCGLNGAAAFILILVGVQVIHDLIYYFGIVVPYPNGANAIIDYMKVYGREGGVWPIIGDSSMMIVMGALAMVFAAYPTHVSVTGLIAGLYMLPYLLTD